MVGFARRAIVFTSLCFTTTLATDCVGSHCEADDETSLVQIKRHLHVGNQRAEQDVTSGSGKRVENVARIIGSTFGMTKIQADAVANRLDTGFDEVHWDGDGVEMGSFTGALLAGKHPFVKQLSKYSYELTDPSRKVVGHYLPSAPESWLFNADNCPCDGGDAIKDLPRSQKPLGMGGGCPYGCHQQQTTTQITMAEYAVTNGMSPGDAGKQGANGWTTLEGGLGGSGEKGSAQYLKLAAADNNAAEPEMIFWLFDEDRGVKGKDKDKAGAPLSETPEGVQERLAGWVGLAEWYAFCETRAYTIINKEGKTVRPNAEVRPWSVTAKEMGWGTKDTPCIPK